MGGDQGCTRTVQQIKEVRLMRLLRRYFRLRSLPGWFLTLVSVLSWVYRTINAWSIFEFIEEKLSGGEKLKLILGWLSSGWILWAQPLILIVGLALIYWSGRNRPGEAVSERESPPQTRTVILREVEKYGIKEWTFEEVDGLSEGELPALIEEKPAVYQAYLRELSDRMGPPGRIGQPWPDEVSTGISHSPSEIGLRILPELRRLRAHGVSLRPSVASLPMDRVTDRRNIERYMQTERDLKNWIRETASVLRRDVSRLESAYFLNCTGALPARLECHIDRLEEIIRRVGGVNAI